MAKYQVIVTDVGRQKMAQAAVDGQKVKITHIAVGDGGGSEVMPQESWTKLTNEVWRGQVSSYEIDPERPDGMRVYGIIPASAGGFTIREMGVFDEAGDLIAVSSTAAMQKPATDSGMSMDMEIFQYILLATTENVEVIIDGNVVSATMQDIQNAITAHDTDPEAHVELIEKMETVIHELATVAKTGSYNDLTDKPNIPDVVDNLDSTSTTDALSANQGNILSGLIKTLTNNSKIVTGSYYGNQSETRNISLGFKPTAVIVSVCDRTKWDVQYAFGMAIANNESSIISITNNGFQVYWSDKKATNGSGDFIYLAWRQ